MRLIFFALLGVNVAVLVLQLTVWRPPGASVVAEHKALGGARLQLLAEAGAASVAAEPAAANSAQEVAPTAVGDGHRETGARAVPREDLCDMVGPFPTLLKAEYLQEHLQSLEVLAQVRELDVPEGVGYWVHLPPEPSREEALRRLREVQSKQIDSYMIPRGELANGISFGMFIHKELAEARLQEMQKQGYAAQVREIVRTQKEIWVVLARGQGQKMSENAWNKLLDSEKGIKKQQKYCQGVASDEKFL